MRSTLVAILLLCVAFAGRPAAQTRQAANTTLTAVPGIKVGHFTTRTAPPGAPSC